MVGGGSPVLVLHLKAILYTDEQADPDATKLKGHDDDSISATLSSVIIIQP